MSAATRNKPVSPAPQLPHERDESSESQTSPPRKVMEQARKDLERGLQDTDRGPVADEAYRKLKGGRRSG